MNRYRGINAHLHSYFQTNSGWVDFHSSHILDLKRTLQRLLPLDSGYIVGSEQSLQIAQYDLFADQTIISRSRTDISIHRTQPYPTAPNDPGMTAVPTLVVPITRIATEPEDMLAVTISRIEDDDEILVTRIELLSPANKPPGSHHRDYLLKRDQTLLSGVNLVELDYLHERRSPIPGIPDYTRREPGASPYYLAVSRNTDGETAVYGFRVDESIPVIPVPLHNDDQVTVDFDSVYQATFASDNRYAGRFVNYDDPPLNFDSYDPTDQQRIQEVMQRDA